jgi:hypothetical protein
MQTPARALLGIAVVACVFIAWRVLRPTELTQRQAGMSGWVDGPNSRCQDQTEPRVRHCRATRRGGDGVLEYGQVGFDPRTLEVHFWMHRWESKDSTRWLQIADSVRRAMDRHGGRAIVCAPVRDDELESLEGWRFRDQDVALSVLRSNSRRGSFRPSPWQVILKGGPLARDCPRVRTRLMTPREIIAAVMRWFAGW